MSLCHARLLAERLAGISPRLLRLLGPGSLLQLATTSKVLSDALKGWAKQEHARVEMHKESLRGDGEPFAISPADFVSCLARRWAAREAGEAPM
jgi:hypothetical protein